MKMMLIIIIIMIMMMRVMYGFLTLESSYVGTPTSNYGRYLSSDGAQYFVVCAPNDVLLTNNTGYAVVYTWSNVTSQYVFFQNLTSLGGPCGLFCTDVYISPTLLILVAAK